MQYWIEEDLHFFRGDLFLRDRPRPVLDDWGRVVLFETAEAAARECRRLTPKGVYYLESGQYAAPSYRVVAYEGGQP